MKQGRLQDKAAIITGSTQGIGRAVAVGYAREGAKVIVCGRSLEKGTKVVEEILSEGGNAHFIQFDLSNEHSVLGLIKQTVEKYDSLDIMVHNAHPQSTLVAATSAANWTISLAIFLQKPCGK